jgi:hypothetical protein
MSHRVERQAGHDRRNQPGVILLITLVILVILATLGYTLTARVAVRRHRDQYIVDYSQARYACASALKYALMMLPDLEPQLVDRANEPDFSDIFAMSEVEYQKLLTDYEKSLAAADANQSRATSKRDRGRKDDADANDANDVDDVNDVNDVNDVGTSAKESLFIPGPYGPPWPLVAEPVKCEIGSAKVRIEIEDESAKYPLNWALIAEDQWKSLADVGLVTFCEWMGYTETEIRGLKEGVAKIAELRPYQLEFRPLEKLAEPPASLRSRVGRQPSAASPARRSAARNVVSAADQAEQQTADFAKLLHSSLVDTDLLSRPSIVSDSRNESAMKYLGLWGTRQVNVNTAPRQVLEAALTFGSPADAPKIADEIIRQRRIKPFANVDEVKNGMLRYSVAIEKCKVFLTTSSSVLTIRITATRGAAKATLVAAVTKEGNKIKQIGVISD